MFSGKKGYTISDLAPLAIVFVILAITVGMGSLVLSNMQTETYDTAAVSNESMGNLTGSTPTIYTVNHASDGDFVKLTDQTAYNDSAHTGTLDSKIHDASAGEVNITEDPGDADDEYLTYDHDQETTMSQVHSYIKDQTATVIKVLVLVIIIVALGVAISVLRGWTGGAGGGGRTGTPGA